MKTNIELNLADEIKYNDHQYVQAASWILEDSRVQSLGLCNFDTQRMTEIIQEGVNIVSNQVQVSNKLRILLILSTH